MATTDSKPVLTLRSERLDTDFIEALTGKYLVMVALQGEDIIYELYEYPTQ